MKKYEIPLKGHYEKTVSIQADSPEQAAEKLHAMLANPALIGFSNEDFCYGEVDLTGGENDGDGYLENEDCSDCPYFCPVYGECIYEGEN